MFKERCVLLSLENIRSAKERSLKMKVCMLHAWMTFYQWTGNAAAITDCGLIPLRDHDRAMQDQVGMGSYF